jgi:hypothetical protein
VNGVSNSESDARANCQKVALLFARSGLTGVAFDCANHPWLFARVARGLGQRGRHDDLCMRVHRRLAVVALLKEG